MSLNLFGCCKLRSVDLFLRFPIPVPNGNSILEYGRPFNVASVGRATRDIAAKGSRNLVTSCPNTENLNPLLARKFFLYPIVVQGHM